MNDLKIIIVGTGSSNEIPGFPEYRKCAEIIQEKLLGAGFRYVSIVDQPYSFTQEADGDPIFDGDLIDDANVVIFVTGGWSMEATLIKEDFPDVKVIIVSGSVILNKRGPVTEEEIFVVDKTGDYLTEVLHFIQEKGL